MSFKKGDRVIQVQPKPIEGTVVDFGIDQETGTPLVRIAYADSDGSTHMRYFNPGELSACK